MTKEEIISTLKHSNSNRPMLLVEGPDDVLFIKKIVETHDIEIDLLPSNGRNDLLEIFEYRSIFGCPVFYFADKDLFVFAKEPMPQEYSEIIWTTGYSLENDLYFESERCFDNMLSSSLKTKKELLVVELCKWYACEIDRYLNNEDYKLDCGVNYILDLQNNCLNSQMITHRNYQDPSKESLDMILNKYQLLVRGHCIFDLLCQIFHLHENSAYHFNTKNLLAISFEFSKCYIESIANIIEEKVTRSKYASELESAVC